MSEGSYIQFGVEGVPFSAVHIAVEGDGPPATLTAISDAMVLAVELQRAYRDAFHGERVRDIEADDVPAADHPNAPRPQQGTPNRGFGQPNPLPNSNTYGGAKFFCPIHNEELRPSTKNHTMEVDERLGMEVPASWFHTVDGKSCSVWRSKALIRMPEAATR